MGRPQFSQAGTAGGGQHIAVNNRPEMVAITSENTASIAAGTNESVEIYAPTGSVYRAQAMQITVPSPGGSSGSHSAIVYPMGHINVTAGGSGPASDLKFANMEWAIANDRQDPSDGASQSMIAQNLTATENAPLEILYKNNTDVSQDNSRDYYFVMEEQSY